MRFSTEDLIDFVKKIAGSDKVHADSDIFREVGISGDDFHDLIEQFSKKYSVDIKNYLWYFHANEESDHMDIGGFFFKSPYYKVGKIPVTPRMLTEFANKGKWDIEYPPHELPKRRHDILINQIITGLFITGILIWYVVKWLS